MTNTTTENTYRKTDQCYPYHRRRRQRFRSEPTHRTNYRGTDVTVHQNVSRTRHLLQSCSCQHFATKHSFDNFNVIDYDQSTRIQLGSSTVWLPALESASFNGSYTTRRCSVAAFRNKYGLSAADLWDKLHFRCTNIEKCNFSTKDIEKAYAHANRLEHHRIFATFEDCAVHSFTSERPILAEADLSAERLVNRTHLFSNRLATLAKQGTSALFEHSGSQIRKTYRFNDRVFTLIFSVKDHWTLKYIKLLRPLEIKSQFGIDLNINHNLPDFSSLFESFGTSGAAAEVIKKLGSITGLLANISILLAQPSTFIACASITAIAANFSSLFASTIAAFLSQPMAQSSFTWVPHAVGLILLTILGVNKLSAVAGFAILQRITGLGTTLSGVGTVTRIIKDAWKDLFPFIYEKIYGTPPDFDEALLELDEFDQLTRAVEDFEKTESYKLIDTNRDICAHVRAMDETLKRVYVTADRRRLRDKFSPAIRVVSKRVEAWMEAVRNSPHKDVGIRVEPVVIYMYGASNCGKSLATTLLITDIIKDHPDVVTQPNVDIANFIYTRNPALEYWEGFTNAILAVIYDDFLQRSDSVANPNPEVLEMFRIKNSAAFQVPKATLSEKKNSYFKAPLVVCTSNQPIIDAKSITCGDALKRRIDIHVKVERDPTIIVGAEVNTECYTFTLVKDDQLTDIKLTYSQLVTLARMKMHAQGQKVVGLAASLNRVRTAPIIDVPLPEHHDMMSFIQNPAFTRNADQVKTTIIGSATEAVPRMAEAHSLLDGLFSPTQSTAMVPYTMEPTPHLSSLERAMLLETLSGQHGPTGLVLDIPSIIKMDLVSCLTPEAKLVFDTIGGKHGLGLYDPWLADHLRNSTAPLEITPENVEKFRKATYTKMCYKQRTELMEAHFSYYDGHNDSLHPELTTGQPSVDPFEFARAQACATFAGRMRELMYKAQDAGGWIWEYVIKSSMKYLWDGVTQPHAGMFQKIVAGYAFFAVFTAIKIAIYKLAHNYGYISADRYNALFGILPEEEQRKLPSAESYTEVVRCVENNVLPTSIATEMSDAIRKKIASESWTHAGKTPAMRTQTTIPRAPKAEAVTDANCKDVSSKVSDNLAMFYIGNGVSIGQHCAIGLFVKDQSCLMNKHSLDQLLNTSSPVFATFPGTYTPVEIVMKDVAYARHPDHDIAMVRFPKLRAHVDIVHQFCTDEDLNFDRAVFKILSRDKKMHPAVIVKGKKMTEAVHSTFGDQIIPITGGFEYEHAETTFGDCGSPVLVVNCMIARKILGIHGAGVATTGFAIAVTRSMVDYLLENFPKSHSLVPPEVTTLHYRQTYLEGNFEYLGTVPPPFDPVRTDVTNAEIFGVFEPTTAPAILKPVHGICPLIRGVEGMGKPKPILSESFLAEVHEVLVALTVPGEAAIARVLTIEEAIFGIPNVLKPIELATSPGYPWCAMQRPVLAPGKTAWIYAETQRIHPDLREAITKRIQQFKDGLIEPPIFKASLKDERRSLKRCDYSKPEDMKTRVFCASPMDFLIVIRMYYGAYFQHIINHRIKNWSTVGINPDSAEWDQLVRHLHHLNTNVKLGDYVGFDSSQSPSFIDAALRPADDFYELHGNNNTEDRYIREGIAQGIKFPTLLVKGDLYRLDGVNPSGVFGTTQINNNVNAAAFYYAWKKICGTGPSDFIKNVRMGLYGDDNIFTVSHAFPDFTSTNVAHALKDVGMTYTAIDKSFDFKEDGLITDASFLKRGFVFIDGHWRAPLDIKTCREMANYTRKSMDNVTATLVNCRTAAIELAYTDPTGKTTEQIEKALSAVGLYERLPRLPEVLINSNKNF
ncbi:replicase protein [Halastavi arva RNA virus]|uniref:replicase protein n=1 Tax=Halastavi arva RNA virus TaxID=1088890 RepID=UPI000239305A|nr:unnamed protein product [Halastavi arva RNA virus]AEP16502.1 replicase protein [Halastavi arva RNA virus]